MRIDSIDPVVPELLALGAQVEVLRPDARRVAVHEAVAELARLHAGAPARS